jgi:hypothetical protein
MILGWKMAIFWIVLWIVCILLSGCGPVRTPKGSATERGGWWRTTVHSFLEVRTAVLNDKLEDAFRHRYPGFRRTNDDQVLSEAA